MKDIRSFKLGVIAESIIRIGAYFALTLTIVMMGIAIFDTDRSQEAYIGSFRTDTFNDGWSYADDVKKEYFSLPIAVPKERGDEVVIVNTLPKYLSNGMSLMIRSNMEDIYVYVDGVLRSEYSSESFENMSYYIPSAYVITNIGETDAGKEIRLKLRFKGNHAISGMTISFGNNVWFDVIKKGLWVVLIGDIVFILGAIVTGTALFLKNTFKVGAGRKLGLLMINVSLWVIGESTLRQIVFSRPSLSQYFSYLLVELIGVFACMYFDEVQHRFYHRRYLVVETIALAQIAINIVLSVGGIFDFYQTMLVSHIWNGLCAIVTIVNIVTDIRTKRIKEYHFTAIGMIGFIILGINEVLGFYLNNFHVFGMQICIGLIILMIATVVQTLHDEAKAFDDREKNHTEMTIRTIETIAGAIDARDEYTGGHSERVGLYAGRLAREMAADYDLSEEDILRVQYVGLVHDIGKIGVADNVLNKPGKLNDEEFSLMKKHTEIGYEIMSSLGNGIEGVLDGIRYHHERFDGKGYPDGLSDTDIPLIARILAIADSYDAMTSNRVYRNRLSDEQVRNELIKCSGSQFDPALIPYFVRLLDNGEIGVIMHARDDNYAPDEIRYSTVLEGLLQRDLLAEKDIINPSHVRMLCYVMKLMERKRKKYIVSLVDAGDKQDILREIVKNNTNAHDVFIQYTKSQFIIARYDEGQAKMDELLNLIRKDIHDATICGLSDVM
jgi:HD-GYP domain-containing protein (c-di-GMP phosphodiesterase class II)